MPAHRRSKNGVASLAYVAGIHDLMASQRSKTWMAGSSPAMTGQYQPDSSINPAPNFALKDPHMPC